MIPLLRASLLVGSFTLARSFSSLRFAHTLTRRGLLGGLVTTSLLHGAAAGAAQPSCNMGTNGQTPAAMLLTQEQAQAIDLELFESFSVDQLMELAGLSVACAVERCTSRGKVMVVAGPGNNGGDGLVAARHLWHFGYEPLIVYPKPTPKPLYENLLKQVQQLGIPVVPTLPAEGFDGYVAVIDSAFGFSFKGKPRPPFDAILATMAATKVPVISVDVPSGWDVEKGDVNGIGLNPAVLVSLTAPKECAKYFNGRHFLGGRFVPPDLAKRYGLVLPPYPGSDQIVEIQEWNGSEAVEPEELTAFSKQLLGEHPELFSSQVRSETLERGARQLAEELAVVWITAPNKAEAHTLASKLVDNELVACVNVVPGVESFYRWEGAVQHDNEVLLMAKTRKSLMGKVSSFVKKHHSYSVPETIAAGLVGGSGEYLKWVKDSTKTP
ncbi:unnamed protein product [Chrysoparadoxa australica]